MRNFVILVGVVISALIVGCGGDTGASPTFTASTASTSTSTTAGTNGGATTGSAIPTGTYGGTFSGSNTQFQAYTGTGSGTIGPGGAATFSYAAQTTGTIQITENRTFNGTIDSSGNFTGSTPQAPSGGGAVQNFPATGTVTALSSTQIKVTITWAFPFSNGGTFYTSTENWILSLQ